MTAKSDFYQVGVNASAANNFILSTDGAGGLKIQRGNVVNGVPAPIGDLLTLDANGRLVIANPDPWLISTPTPVPGSGAFGSASASLRYRKVGPMVFYKATVDITTLGTVGVNTTINLALPFPCVTTSTSDEWDGAGRESKLIGYTVYAFVQSGLSNLTLTPGAGASMANGHRLNASGFYETAS